MTVNLSTLLTAARGLESPSTMAPGVTDAEAHVAAWHAIVVQGGFSSPEREAWRLASDYGTATRTEAEANGRAVTSETPVDFGIVQQVLADLKLTSPGLPVATQPHQHADFGKDFDVPATQPDVQANDRGEWTQDGKLYHGRDVVHEGPWLNCDGCNPVVVVQPKDDPETGTSALVALRGEYAHAKHLEKEAKERVDVATSRLKAALSEASGEATRVALHIPGFKPLNLTYVESWRLDTKALKASHPAVYVEFAKRSGSWRLEESRGQ